MLFTIAAYVFISVLKDLKSQKCKLIYRNLGPGYWIGLTQISCRLQLGCQQWLKSSESLTGEDSQVSLSHGIWQEALVAHLLGLCVNSMSILLPWYTTFPRVSDSQKRSRRKTYYLLRPSPRSHCHFSFCLLAVTHSVQFIFKEIKVLPLEEYWRLL